MFFFVSKISKQIGKINSNKQTNPQKNKKTKTAKQAMFVSDPSQSDRYNISSLN